MTVKLLTEHHFEFLGLKGGYTGSLESALVKIPHCWKSHVTAQLYMGLHIRPYANSHDVEEHVHMSSLARNPLLTYTDLDLHSDKK